MINPKCFRWMVVWVIKMLQYERMNTSEGIDINKSKNSKECMICYYWYFKDIGYKFEPYFPNVSHDKWMIVSDLDDFMMLNIKVVGYGCFV